MVSSVFRVGSDLIRTLVQRQFDHQPVSDRYVLGPPRAIVQFWDDLRQLPKDVEECIASWARWEAHGFTHRLFDEHSARDFIVRSLGARHQLAFERCYHPAMQADYFRLCYLWVEGGLYVDADDVCVSADIACLFDDGRLKVQPLCYDSETDKNLDPSMFLRADAHSSSWTFYFANSPLIAAPGNPIIESALVRATDLLEAIGDDEFPEIQTTTGPGNISKAIFDCHLKSGGVENDMMVLREWGSFSKSRWSLSYRKDHRNWRRSNRQKFNRNATQFDPG